MGVFVVGVLADREGLAVARLAVARLTVARLVVATVSVCDCNCCVGVAEFSIITVVRFRFNNFSSARVILGKYFFT
ncbi:MAG: hypothetical protein LBQ05_03195, partial [Christensenellaceae bacterium]|nr:hypothetical protein [Christensenellaceae bacterium]